MKTLYIIKIGGNILDDQDALQAFVNDLAQLKEACIIVHGGGKLASEMSSRLNIETRMVNGRRITDAATLQIVTMVYAGWINKSLVALMQSKGINAFGLCGADGNIIQATKREHPEIDFGFVGDIKPESVDTEQIEKLINNGMQLVFSAITHDGKGQLLNTNADTIAAVLSEALCKKFEVHLYYCFEKNGVLINPGDEQSYMESISRNEFSLLKQQGVISSGMLPKLENAFSALQAGAASVHILHAKNLLDLIHGKNNKGTRIKS